MTSYDDSLHPRAKAGTWTDKPQGAPEVALAADSFTCSECAQTMILGPGHISHHVDADGNVDHDADGDHVAYDLDACWDCGGPIADGEGPDGLCVNCLGAVAAELAGSKEDPRYIDPALLPHPPTLVTVGAGANEYNVFTGSKYVANAPLEVIAAGIRADLLEAREEGLIPSHATPRVVQNTAGRSLAITVEGLTEAEVDNPLRHSPGELWSTPAAGRVLAAVYAVAESYNRWQQGHGADASAADFYFEASLPTV